MARVKRGVIASKRKKNILSEAKGYRGRRKSTIKAAKQAVIKAGVYAYRDRRTKKRNFRRLWQVRINAAARERGITYSRFIEALKKGNIEIDRKILAEIAMNNPSVFDKIFTEATQ
ncbi:MAG: 50S ribosomal protein L20 [bacterium]